MEVAVVGSRSWKDYYTLIRKMTVLVEDWTNKFPDDDRLVIWHTGSAGAERMVSEWVGKVEGLAKQNGKSIKDKIFFSTNQIDDLANSEVALAVVFDDNQDPRCKAFLKAADSSNLKIILA